MIEQARDRVKLGFWACARVGVPLTLATLAVGTIWPSFVAR